MAHAHPQDDKLTGIKLQFEVLLEEYKILRNVADGHRKMQGQLDSIALAGLGLSIPLVLAVIDRSPTAVGPILLMPILFFAITYLQIRHEQLFVLTIVYLDTILRPEIERLLSQLRMNNVPVFGYERFFGQHSWGPHLALTWWISAASKAGISLAIGTGLIVVYLYLRLFLYPMNWNTYEVWLLVINLVVLVGDLVMAFAVGRMRHRYSLQQGYYKKAHPIEKDSS